MSGVALGARGAQFTNNKHVSRLNEIILVVVSVVASHYLGVVIFYKVTMNLELANTK